jgi:MFS family permease
LKIFIFSAILISATTLIVPYFENLILLIALRILNGLSVGALLAYCSSSIVRGFQENYQASAMGIYQSLFSVGIFLGPILSGLIGSQINLASVFILSSFISLLLIPVSFFMKSKEFAI